MNLELQGLGARHDTARVGAGDALLDLTFRVEAGESVAIVGPSGAGKTTLLEVLAGARRPTQGLLRLDGSDPWSLPRRALHALRRSEVVMGLVGYDDFELADLVEPPVTVIHQDPASLGQKAALQLFARLLGDESPPHTVVMPTRLIVRSSGRLSTHTAPRKAPS